MRRPGFICVTGSASFLQNFFYLIRYSPSRQVRLLLECQNHGKCEGEEGSGCMRNKKRGWLRPVSYSGCSTTGGNQGAAWNDRATYRKSL